MDGGRLLWTYYVELLIRGSGVRVPQGVLKKDKDTRHPITHQSNKFYTDSRRSSLLLPTMIVGIGKSMTP
jgi:hypothetical protein